MEPTRRGILFSGAAAGLALATGARGASPSAPKYLVTVLARGGWDVTYCFDPKLGVGAIEGPEIDPALRDDDEDAVQTFGEIDIVVNNVKRPNVTSWFERWHTKAQVVSGIWLGSIAHDPCRFRILTGTTLNASPDFATITGYARSESEPLGSLDLSGWSMAGALAASTGSIGWQSQLRVLIDPATEFTASNTIGAPYPLFRPQQTDADAVAAYLKARAGAFRDARAGAALVDARVDDLLESWDRAERFSAASATIAQKLPLGKQPDLPLQIELCVDALQSGLCRAVTIDSGLDWDTHDMNIEQHGFYDSLFYALDLLASVLEERGILDQTLVSVVSEMTRTPKRNGTGKDHWPHTSALFFGGGIRGGVKSGATDEQLESWTVDLENGVPYTDRSKGSLLRYDNLVAGVLEHMDVDPAEWLPGVQPFRGFGV